MTRPEPFVVPSGWTVSTSGGTVVATRPGPSPARIELRHESPPSYDAMVVEDEDSFDLAGHRVDYRRFGHCPGGVELVSEEWTWLVGDRRLVLTGTVAREDYLSVCDVFEDVAATVEPWGPAASA